MNTGYIKAMTEWIKNIKCYRDIFNPNAKLEDVVKELMEDGCLPPQEKDYISKEYEIFIGREDY